MESSGAADLAALESMATASSPSFVYRNLLLALLVAAAPFAASAAGTHEHLLTIQNRRIEPATLKASADTRFKMLVTNEGSTPSEFESNEFNRRRIMPPNSTVTVFISSSLVVLLAAGLSSGAAGFLIQADWLPAWGSQLWNTSWLLGNGSLLGQTLHVLVGYEARPAGMQLVFWLVTALVLFTGMRWMAARMVPASARSKSRQATTTVRTRAADTA